MDAALEGARLRLRPILMTSFAFILGCVPLWTAKGAGAVGREVLGTAVITGMLAATMLGVFLVPVLFVLVERIAKKKPHVAVAQPAVLEGEHTDAKNLCCCCLSLLLGRLHRGSQIPTSGNATSDQVLLQSDK